jgi:hypothetical protein
VKCLSVGLLSALVACSGGSSSSGLDSTTPSVDPSGDADGQERAFELKKGDAAPPQRMTPALAKASERYSRRVAVTIGVDAYTGGIPPLHAAASDARRMAELFRKMGYDEVVSLENTQATRKGILDVLERQVPMKTEEKDLVTVYFAGHGVTHGDMGYVLPQDASKEVEKTAISVQELKEVALRMKARHVLYLVDSCFSGSMFKRAAQVGQPNELAFWEAAAEGRVIQILTAGGADQTVLENDGWGAFTRVIHAGLRGEADANDDGVVTLEELAKHTTERVTKVTKGHQTPLWGNIEGTGTIALFDARRIPVGDRRNNVVRPLVEGMEDELSKVHERMNRRDWSRAEQMVRDLALKHDHVELKLLLAEIYLSQDALGNSRIIGRELERIERADLSPEQQKRMLDLRARLEKARRGPM